MARKRKGNSRAPPPLAGDAPPPLAGDAPPPLAGDAPPPPAGDAPPPPAGDAPPPPAGDAPPPAGDGDAPRLPAGDGLQKSFYVGDAPPTPAGDAPLPPAGVYLNGRRLKAGDPAFMAFLDKKHLENKARMENLSKSEGKKKIEEEQNESPTEELVIVADWKPLPRRSDRDLVSAINQASEELKYRQAGVDLAKEMLKRVDLAHITASLSLSYLQAELANTCRLNSMIAAADDDDSSDDEEAKNDERTASWSKAGNSNQGNKG